MAIRTYDILLDSYNSTIPEPIVGRQGDKNGAVTLHVSITDRGAAVDLTGQTINLMAETAKGTAIVADNDGVTVTNATGGKFDYAIPNALWSEAGKITKAYFSLNDANGQQTTYDLIFIVKKAADMTKEDAKDWISILSDIIEQYNQWSNDAHNSWEQFVDDNKAIIESIDPSGKVLSELIDFRHSDMLSKTFDTARKRGDFFDQEFADRGLNVKWFGAVGDGMTDDTTAIVAAMASTTNNKLFLPRGTYLISESINLNKDLYGEPGTTIKCSIAGLDYMFKLDGSSAANKKSLVVVNIKFDTQLSRGNIFCKALSSVRLEKCEFTGYDAEANYYKTDSAVMLQNVESFFGSDLYFHDHGFQYTANSGKLNRCITMQGEANKLARVDNIVIERANQGIVVDCPAITMTLSNAYFTETKDNDLYLLQLDYFSAANSIFDVKYDESNVISYGNYNYTNCTWRNCPRRIIAINNDVTSLIVQDCNFLQTDGYFGSPVAFRDANYRINSLIFKNNRGVLYPPDGTADVFTFGQLDYFDISNNVIKLSSIADYQRLFSFRNADDRVLNGKLINNAVLPLNSANDISNKYFFVDYMKDSAYTHIYLEGNVTSKGRFLLKPGIVAGNTRVLGNTGPYGFDVKVKSHLSSDYYPTIGTWKAGTVVWNESPTAENKTLCWLRITDGDNNALGTDWLAVKGS